MKIQIKLEYYILFSAWVFWAIADGFSWHFYDSSTLISNIVIIKSIQFIFTAFLSLGLMTFFIQILKKHLSKTYNIIIFSLGIVFASFLTAIVNNSISLYLSHMPIEFPEFKKLMVFVFFKIIYHTGFSTLFFMLRKNRELQQEKNNTLAAQNMATTAQLQMLQQQINPHFLFNSLNSLRSLIVQDPIKAREMVTNISEFLRETLHEKNESHISLKNEVEIAMNYLDIQKIRFGSNLDISYNIEEDCLQANVPAFLLQPLAENAIKHGMRSNCVLHITIGAKMEEGFFIAYVINNGSLKTISNGNGNTNIIKRLRLLYNDSAEFKMYEQDGHVHSEVRIKQNCL